MARTLLLGLAAAVVPLLSAAAAPATPDEAARLSALFERYVGHSPDGAPSSVTVTPKGESYAVTLDLKRATGGLASLGVTLDPYTTAATLTPRPDGTWTVQSSDSPPLIVHYGDTTLSFAAATSAFSSVFDPKLQAFSRFEQQQTGYTYTQTTSRVVQSRRIDRVGVTGSGAAADGGTVTLGTHYALSGTAADVLLKSAAPDPAPGGNLDVPSSSGAGTAYSYTIPAGMIDVALDRVRTGGLLDLWAFLVAHPNRESLAAAQDALKTLLRGSLPFADAIKESASFDKVAVTTPMGVVTMKTLAGAFDVTGLSGTGTASTALTVADLALPTAQLPPWSAGLVPTGLDLHVTTTGFHAAEAAMEAVADVDLKKDVIVTPEQKTALGHVFWPRDGALTLAPSRITTKALDIAVDGQATFGTRISGKVTVKAKGLDAEIASLQSEAGTDPGAGQVLGPLVLAKNLARPDPDGGFMWIIEFGEGPVRVNGALLQ